MSSSIPVVPTISSSPSSALSTTQLTTVLTAIDTSLQGKSFTAVLAAIPGLVSVVFQTVTSFTSASPAVQQSLVLSLITQGISKLSLPAEEVTVISAVVQYLVPELISLLPQIEAGIVSGFTVVEEEVEACCKSWFGCC